jgi:hypothetical protein
LAAKKGFGTELVSSLLGGGHETILSYSILLINLTIALTHALDRYTIIYVGIIIASQYLQLNIFEIQGERKRGNSTNSANGQLPQRERKREKEEIRIIHR